jgi:predicted small secreted protein
MRSTFLLKTKKIKGREVMRRICILVLALGLLITGCQDGYIQETGEALMENTADASFAPGSL